MKIIYNNTEHELRPAAAVPAGTYYVRYSDTLCMSNTVKITVRDTLPKVTASAKEAVLLSRDRFDSASVEYRIDDKDGLFDTDIIDIAPESPAANLWFELRRDGGTVTFSWKDRAVSLSAGSVRTMKLNVWFEGIDRPVPVSVRIRIK